MANLFTGPSGVLARDLLAAQKSAGGTGPPEAARPCTIITAIPPAIWYAALNSPSLFAIRATDFLRIGRAQGACDGACDTAPAGQGALFWGAFSKSVGDQGLTYGIDVRYGGQHHY